MNRIRIVAALLAVAFAVVAGAGLAQARPTEAPRVALYGNTLWTAGGDHANCRGNIQLSLKTDPRRRGVVYVTYRPGSFVGDGPSWTRHPVCTTRVWANWGTQLPGGNWSKLIKAGPRGGKAVTKTLHTGSGLQAIGFGTAGIHHSLAYYLIVP